MSTQHTPGPWRVASRTIGGWRVDTHTPDMGANATVAIGSEFVPWISAEESEANARLIAAAPEMLAALHAMLRDDDNSEARWMAGQAIAKAEGRA